MGVGEIVSSDNKIADVLNTFFSTIVSNVNRPEYPTQGLQAFAFSVVTVNNEHRKLRFKIKCRG